jgi:hypothetical protein
MLLKLISLRDIRARWWAIAYFLLIPSFAVVYHLLPRIDPHQFHFYHASAQYEQFVYADAANVISGLQAELVQNFQETYHADSTQMNGWNINIRDLKITGLRPREDTVEIYFGINLQKGAPAKPIVAGKSFRATVPIVYQDVIVPDLDVVCKPLVFDSEKLTIFNGETIDFASIFVPRKQICYSPTLGISQTLNDRLVGFWRATRGFPTNASGGFIRMLYFSAITITTIGYGDIYPISTVARLLVASEAILGVVLVGLFLNAVVQERRTKS